MRSRFAPYSYVVHRTRCGCAPYTVRSCTVHGAAMRRTRITVWYKCRRPASKTKAGGHTFHASVAASTCLIPAVVPRTTACKCAGKHRQQTCEKLTKALRKVSVPSWLGRPLHGSYYLHGASVRDHESTRACLPCSCNERLYACMCLPVHACVQVCGSCPSTGVGSWGAREAESRIFFRR